MRMRKKKNLLPRMERRAASLIREPYEMPGRWRELMPQARELRLELGCGKGRFTAGTAQAEPDVLFVAVEVVPDAMVVAMERCAALPNVFFVSANADQLPYFFAPGEVDRIYLNFSDPWPSGRHARRRLTHGNFLKLYRQVLRQGGRLEFKTDNIPLFDFSLEELPRYGFSLSEVTRNLHEHGPVGVMTDYEAKFHEQGLPICRLVGTMEEWEEPFPAELREVRRRWVESFAAGVSREIMKEHVFAPGNCLWHIFTWGEVPCLKGEEARRALEQQGECWLFYTDNPPEGASRISRVEHPAEVTGEGDFYLTDRNFTWTYVHTHEEGLGPYFCRR